MNSVRQIEALLVQSENFKDKKDIELVQKFATAAHNVNRRAKSVEEAEATASMLTDVLLIQNAYNISKARAIALRKEALLKA